VGRRSGRAPCGQGKWCKGVGLCVIDKVMGGEGRGERERNPKDPERPSERRSFGAEMQELDQARVGDSYVHLRKEC
jgi:hypothetical protein